MAELRELCTEYRWCHHSVAKPGARAGSVLPPPPSYQPAYSLSLYGTHRPS